MSRADILDACTNILTTLAEIVNERPDVRARIHSIGMQSQGQVPDAANKENSPSQSAVTPGEPGRGTGWAPGSGFQADTNLRSMSDIGQSPASYLGFLISSKTYEHPVIQFKQ